MINKEIVKNRRAEHAVLPPPLANSCVSTICQQLCFVPIHSRRKCRELTGQRFGLSQIAAWHLEGTGKLLRLFAGSGEAGRPERKHENYPGDAMYRLAPPPLILACDSERRRAE